jgi:hypothetical protein
MLCPNVRRNANGGRGEIVTKICNIGVLGSLTSSIVQNFDSVLSGYVGFLTMD